MTPKNERLKILIIRLSGLGDVVHTLPFLVNLRYNFPEAYIAWLVKKEFKELLENHPDLNEVILFNRKSIFSLIPLIKILREKRFDIVFDPQRQFRSGFFAWVSGAEKRVGFSFSFSKEFNWLFINKSVRIKDKEKHMIEKVGALIRGVHKENKFRGYGLRIPVSNVAKDFLDDISKDENRPLIGINPGSSRVCKIWPIEKYAILSDKILEEFDVNLIFFWGPKERGLIDSIVSLMRNKPLIAPSTGIKDLLYFFQHIKLLIGSDSGPLHLAVAVGTKVIGLYGHTEPMIWGPYGEKNVAIKKDISIIGCPKKRCRFCKRDDCMELITVEDVLSKVRENLKEHVIISQTEQLKPNIEKSAI